MTYIYIHMYIDMSAKIPSCVLCVCSVSCAWLFVGLNFAGLIPAKCPAK